MAGEAARTLGNCYPPCPERLEAVIENAFGPAKSLGGWVFREGPFREPSWRARYYGFDDTHGKPYVWVTCPWCGKDLAPPPDDEGLADPEE